jgi:O-antigen/teichoic acid export membrane protein
MALLLLPLTLVLFVFAPDILELWLNADFADRSSAIMRWLSVGVLVNAVGQVPFAYLQAVGRADLTGRLHLVELPAYLLALWLVLELWGIEAVAALWTLRASADAAAMFYLAHRAVALPRSGETRVLLAVVATLLPPSVCLLLIADTGTVRVLAFVMGTACLAFAIKRWIVEPPEWQALLERGREVRRRAAV